MQCRFSRKSSLMVRETKTGNKIHCVDGRFYYVGVNFTLEIWQEQAALHAFVRGPSNSTR